MMRAWSVVSLILPLLVPCASGGAADAEPCGAAVYHALGFTIGTWTITDPSGTDRGTATIAYSLDGCAVQETWSAPDGHRGTNIDAYSADDRHWHRLFVDNKGHVHTFAGDTNGASIRYFGDSKGPNGSPVLNRLVISMHEHGAMLQVWQQSDDGGRRWRRVFEDRYRLARG